MAEKKRGANGTAVFLPQRGENLISKYNILMLNFVLFFKLVKVIQ
jgi:hypothetical protein